MMNTHKLSLSMGAALLGLAIAAPAVAGFDQWQISEIFSSADGSIQFIELSTSAADQQDLNGVSLQASNTGGLLQNTTVLSGNLTGSTASKNVLIATQAFATLTGLTPDYLISPSFLFTGGGTVNFGNGVSSVTYAASQLPLNGVQSINSNLVAADATPTNFADSLSATIVAPVPAKFDVATSILNLPMVDVPTVGLANLSFDVDLQAVRFALRNDFFLYGPGIVAGGNAAQLLPGNILSIPVLPIGNESYAFKMSIVAENPLTFGNLTDIAVTNTAPAPEPEPEPQPSELQQSIDRGRTDYELRCAVCHGASGGGGSSAFGPAPSLITTGFNTFATLRSRTDLTMPIENPALCRDSSSSSCATDVTNFILNVFQ